MRKEATGENGAILGSSEYWDRVNCTTFFGRLMRNASETNYQETLREVGHRAGSAVEEIYDDLQNNIKSVRAISSDRRSSLAKQVQELYDVCSMAGAFCSHSSDCIGILNLSSFYLPGTSFGDDRAIQNAIHKIKNCSDFFASECIDLIRQAADWSISFAAGSDARKNAFLKDVSQGKDLEFLRDVLSAYYSSNDTADLRGNCGYSIGSREYRDYMERKVFLQDMPAMSGDDYDGALRDALTSIANQLQRDLTKNERENNYITDETARKLRDAANELGRCGVSVGFADSSIERLNWFVGGDPDKIRKIQQLLNTTGLVFHLTEDGVYGQKTAEAEKHIVDRFRNRLEEILLNPAAMEYLTSRISLNLSFLSSHAKTTPGISPAEVATDIAKVMFDNRKGIQRFIWKQGADLYLRKRGYNVAAFLLEHSLESIASNLHFSQSHWVTQKVMRSNGFLANYRELEKNIKQNPDVYAVSGKMEVNFQETGDTDLFLGIGKCAIKYTCVHHNSTVYVNFTLDDDYNFEELRSFMGGTERFIELSKNFGSWANDAGFISQADGVISPYKISINFQKTIETEGVYV